MASLTKSAKFLKPHHVAQKKNILSATSIKTVATQANQKTKNDGNAVAAHLNKIRPVLEKKHLPNPTRALEFIYAPLKSDGLEVDLNWSLHQLYIAPQYDAYRNATAKKLVHFAPGRTDANKALVVKSTKEQNYDKFSTGKDQADAKELSATHTRRVQREIGYHFSVSPAIFVQDGDAGAYNGAKIRVVTDNGATGLFLKHMILPIKKDNCESAKFDAQVQAAAAYQFTPSHIVEEFNGPQISDLGLSKEQFIITDRQASVATIAGLSDTSFVKNAIVSVAAPALLTKNALLVNGDAIVSANGSVTLVLGNSANDAAGLYAPSESFALYGAHNAVLSEDGLSRFWNGVSYETSKDKAQTEQYDLVEELNDNTVRVTRSQKGNAIPNLVNKPSNIILLVKDGNFLLPQLSKVNNLQAAADILASGLSSIEKDAVFNGSSLPSSSHPLDATERLQQLLPSVNVYIINSAYDAKEIQQAIQVVSSGEAKDASELPGSAGKLSTVKHSSLKSKAWKDAQAFQKQLETLMSKVQQQLQSLPQRPQPAQPQQPAAPQQPQQKQ